MPLVNISWCNYKNNSVERQEYLGCRRRDCFLGGCEFRTRAIVYVRRDGKILRVLAKGEKVEKAVTAKSEVEK